MTITNEMINELAENRETSNEIAEAILEQANGDMEQAVKIWENGYNEDTIVARAWELADEDEERLCWGVDTYER